MIDQDEAARSAGQGSLDRTTQATGQHYRDGVRDQDEAARSAGPERSRGRAREAGPSRREEDWPPEEGDSRLGLGLGLGLVG